MRNPEELFHTSLRESCDALFESLPLTVLAALGRARDCALNTQQLASMVGFVSSEVKGAITVRAPISFFSGTYPTSKKEALGLREVSDWAAEIANQLLGRMKNMILPYAVSLSVATPATVYGNFLKEAEPREGSLRIVFPWHDDEICVSLEMSFEPGFLLLDEPASENVPLQAGDALVF
jgi:hypothetical protein